jgi:opacity protein-like surface antigen
MSSRRFLCFAATIAVLILPAIAEAQGGGPDVSLRSGQDPVVNAQVNFLMKQGVKGTAVSDGTGHVTVPNNVVSAAKPEEQFTAYKDACQNQYYIVENGAEDQLPPEDPNCPRKRKKYAGYVKFGAAGSNVIDDGTATVTFTGVASSGPSPATLSQQHKEHLFSLQFDGGLGLTRFNNANTCRSVLDDLPGASCRASNKSFAFGVGGTLKITPYFGLRLGYTRANAITRNFDSSSPGLITAKDTFQPGYFLVMPSVFLPVGRLNFFADGGLAYHQINLFERQSVGGGVPTTTTLHDSGAGPGFGGGLQLSLNKNFGFRFEYQYLAARKSDFYSEHNHVGTFGVYFNPW